VAPRPDVVAIFNSNADLVSLLRFALERAGFVVVIGHVQDVRSGMLDLSDFVSQHEPRVIVYDVVMPYDSNWNFLSHIRNSASMQGRHFVITAPNVDAVDRVVGPNEMVYEIVTEGDLDSIVQAVREASKARLVR
jgi:CheY-like chemotaxis protein